MPSPRNSRLYSLWMVQPHEPLRPRRLGSTKHVMVNAEDLTPPRLQPISPPSSSSPPLTRMCGRPSLHLHQPSHTQTMRRPRETFFCCTDSPRLVGPGVTLFLSPCLVPLRGPAGMSCATSSIPATNCRLLQRSRPPQPFLIDLVRSAVRKVLGLPCN